LSTCKSAVHAVQRTMHGLHGSRKDYVMSKKVKTKLRKVARIHDKGTNTYLDVIEFPISKSHPGALELAPSVVGDRPAFARKLRDAGADLPTDRDDLKQTLEAVANSDPPEKWVYEAQTGWLNGQKAFVLTSGVIGKTKAKIIGVNPAKAAKDYTGRKSEQGDWQGWRDNVAEPARHSTTLMVAICAALAAPLLDVVRGQSFAINFFGPTRAGKSIATLLAASVIGIGRLVDLISWKITNARLDERLPEFNDLVFPIDDLNTMHGGNDRQKYQRIQNLAYAIAQGSETQRSAAYVAARDGRQGVWRTIVVTSFERSVHDLARSLRLERQRGEALRLIDVPATFDGHGHVFDRLPRDVIDVDATAWRGRAFEALAKAVEQNHGTALRRYIESIIARQASLEEDVRKIVGDFVKQACNASDGDVVRDVGRKFGLIYAGGVVGIQCGLLPWKEARLRAAVTKSFMGARDLLPDPGVLLRQGRAALKALRGRLPTVTDGDAGVNYGRLEGFKQRDGDRNRYVIKTEDYNNTFTGDEQQELVTRWLIETRRVTLAKLKTADPKPKKQICWPDGERRRSIEIFFRVSDKKADKKTGKEIKKQTGKKTKKKTVAKKSVRLRWAKF
jgi:hypothetical protein